MLSRAKPYLTQPNVVANSLAALTVLQKHHVPGVPDLSHTTFLANGHSYRIRGQVQLLMLSNKRCGSAGCKFVFTASCRSFDQTVPVKSMVDLIKGAARYHLQKLDYEHILIMFGVQLVQVSCRQQTALQKQKSSVFHIFAHSLN